MCIRDSIYCHGGVQLRPELTFQDYRYKGGEIITVFPRDLVREIVIQDSRESGTGRSTTFIIPDPLIWNETVSTLKHMICDGPVASDTVVGGLQAPEIRYPDVVLAYGGRIMPENTTLADHAIIGGRIGSLAAGELVQIWDMPPNTTEYSLVRGAARWGTCQGIHSQEQSQPWLGRPGPNDIVNRISPKTGTYVTFTLRLTSGHEHIHLPLTPSLLSLIHI